MIGGSGQYAPGIRVQMLIDFSKINRPTLKNGCFLHVLKSDFSLSETRPPSDKLLATP